MFSSSQRRRMATQSSDASETNLSLLLTTLPLLQEERPSGEAWTSPGSERRVVLP